jgi:hemoglobin
MTSSTYATDVPLYHRIVLLAGTEEVFTILSKRLYERILGPAGSDPAVAGDPALVPFFYDADGEPVDRARLERHMAQFLTAALGGPRHYSGRTMAAAHDGLGITDDAFDAVLRHVVAVLRELGVPGDWIGEIGAAVAPLRGPIVTG